MLEKSPEDAFLLYGMALELKNRARPDDALRYLERVVAADSGYCYAYYQVGQIHEDNGAIEEAKVAYRRGVEAADRVNDARARAEIAAALDVLG